jgi:hypothetical protein
MDADPAPNPKLRRTGLVLLVLVVLCYVGAATGFDAHGTTGRVLFGVIGTLLLVPAVLLLRSRQPAVTSVRADAAGLAVGVAGRAPVTVPWELMESVWLTRLSPQTGFRFSRGGYLLGFDYAAGAAHVPALAPFERATHGATRVTIGLTGAQSPALLRDLPSAAGARYRASSAQR